MKKNLGFAALMVAGAVAMPALVSCGGGSKSEVKKDQLTADLAYNDLKGPVKMVTLKNDWGDGAYQNGELFFDTDGTWLNLPRWQGYEVKKYPNYNGDKAERNDDGYIVKIYGVVEEEGDWGNTETVNIVWENGRPKQKTTESKSDPDMDYYSYSQSVTDYAYDDKGNLVKETTKNKYSGTWGSSEGKSTNTYTYVTFDDKGNWTKRYVTSTSQYDKNAEPYTSNYTELRDILYYE